MSNEHNKNDNNQNEYDYRFIDYRLDQLETNLRKGQEKLEQDFKAQNTQILQTLQLMQEGQNEQNKTLIELTQRVQTLEEKKPQIEHLKESSTENTTEIHELERRLDVYKQVLIGIGISVAAVVLVDLLKLI